MNICRLLIVLIGIFLTQGLMAAENTKTEKFISVADIHFDPFLECKKSVKPCSFLEKIRRANVEEWTSIFEKEASKKISQTGSDTNFILLKTSLQELKRVSEKEHPKFVLILGDSLAHNFRDRYRLYTGDLTSSGYQTFVKKVMMFLTIKINDIFPKIDVYSIVGNNDGFTGSYHVVPNGNYFREMSNTWSILIKNSNNKKSFRQDFPKAGYYSVTIPNHNNQKIIVLNTVLFSKKVKGPHVNEAAVQQMQWLEQQLSFAKEHQQKVMLAFHIPADINIANTFHENLGIIWRFWQPTYWEEFKKISKKYPETITAILPAHIHKDLFQFLMLGTFSKIPVNFTPSISPIFGNDPAFKVFTYQEPEFYITNINTYAGDFESDKKFAWAVEYKMKVPRIKMENEKLLH